MLKPKKVAMFGVTMAVFVIAEPSLERKCSETYEGHTCHSLVEHFLPHDHSERSEVVATTTNTMSVSGGASTQHYGYQLELQCRECGEIVGHICDLPSETLSAAEAEKIFANEDVWCQCGWSGKVGPVGVIRVNRNTWLPA